MKELIKAYEEYIDFLEEDIASNASYLMVHGITTSEETIKRGEELRKKIKDLKSPLPQ